MPRLLKRLAATEGMAWPVFLDVCVTFGVICRP